MSVTKAFNELTKNNFFAKRSFWCCRTCAWSDIGEQIQNVCYYTEQGAKDLKKYGYVHLYWRGDGHKIVEVFKKHGFIVDWDGSENMSIKITKNNITK